MRKGTSLLPDSRTDKIRHKGAYKCCCGKALNPAARKKYEAEEIPLSVLESKKNNGFKVTVNDGVYSVEADWLYRILSKTDLDDYASLQYFQTVLKSSGIIDELVKQGIQEGDTVSIYDLEFDYIP